MHRPDAEAGGLPPFQKKKRHGLQESMISLSLFETQKQEAVNKEPLFAIVL